MEMTMDRGIHSLVPDHKPAQAEHLAYRIQRELLPIMQGRENARTSNELMRFLGYKSKATNKELRAACKVLLVEKGIPLVSCSAGFFEAIRRKELTDYRDDLNNRAQALFRNVKAINHLLADWTGTQAQMDLDWGK